MSDYAYGGAEEIENAELRKLNAEVQATPDDYEAWQKLVAGAEALEGGLNRNSSPQSISAARDIYDRFLAKFPLFFGYWKKYADLEFAIAGTEAAELVHFPFTLQSSDKVNTLPSRYTSEALPASAYPLIFGPTTALSKSRLITIKT